MLGVHTAGVCSIWTQFSFVAFAASSFFWATPLHASYIICVAVVINTTNTVDLYTLD